jgi:threonine aldolase
MATIQYRARRNRLSEIFEHDLGHPVTGTAANALALATLCPPHNTIFCHAESSIAVMRPRRIFSHGISSPIFRQPWRKDRSGGRGGGAGFQRGVRHQPAVVSIPGDRTWHRTSQPNRAIAGFAHRHRDDPHVDGARFANACCEPLRLPNSPERRGVDAASFGAMKNGALCAGVIFADAQIGSRFQYRRGRTPLVEDAVSPPSSRLFNDNRLRTQRAADSTKGSAARAD